MNSHLLINRRLVVAVANAVSTNNLRCGALQLPQYRLISTSDRRGAGGGLSDPFKASKRESDKDVSEYVATKRSSMRSKNNTPLDETDVHVRLSNSDGVLARLVKWLVNPKPLNIRLRNTLHLDNTCKLVYLIDNERLFIIVYASMSLFALMFVSLVGVFAYAELTGGSQMKKSFDNPYEITAGLTIWMVLIMLMVRHQQAVNILRIYYDEATNKFIAVNHKNFFKFVKTEFKPSDVTYRFDTDAASETAAATAKATVKFNFKRAVDSFTQNFGNVYIKNELKMVNLKGFAAPNYIHKMFGKETYNKMESKGEF